jgi:hypothetical protein
MSFISLENIGFRDGPQLDAFGRIRTSQPNTLFDSQQEYGLSPTLWSTQVSGGGSSVTHNTNTRMMDITCGTGASDLAILQSIQYVRYIPGKSQEILLTGIFSPGVVANNTSRAGYFDFQNGVFLEVTNGAYSIVRRSSTSGVIVNETIAQANWNVDRFDGTGPSGVTLDLTKMQVLYITAQWLGAGRIEVGFNIDGSNQAAHQFLVANVLLTPSTQTFNLPVRVETVNTAGSAGATITFNCCSVQSEGGVEPRGNLRTANRGITSVGVTTRRPVLSVRPAATFNGFVNRGHIEGRGISFRTTTNDMLWELVFGGSLTGASFAAVSAPSIAEFDVSATAITGGIILASGYSIAGQGNSALLVSEDFDIRFPLTISKIDAGATVQPNVSLVCTSVTGTSNVMAEISWFEQFI